MSWLNNVIEPGHEILVVIAYVRKLNLNTHTDISKCAKFWLQLFPTPVCIRFACDQRGSGLLSVLNRLS